MPQGLGELLYMKDCRDMSFPHLLDTRFKCFAQAGIIPSLHFIDIYTIGPVRFSETFEGGGNRIFYCLIFLWNGNAVAIIPYKYGERHLEHGGSVHRFPEMPFGSAGVTDGSKAYFIPVIR